MKNPLTYLTRSILFGSRTNQQQDTEPSIMSPKQFSPCTAISELNISKKVGPSPLETPTNECAKLNFSEVLPAELVLHILSFLDPASLSKVSNCSQRLNMLTNHNIVWRAQYRKKKAWNGSILQQSKQKLIKYLQLNCPLHQKQDETKQCRCTLDWKFLFRNRMHLERNWRIQKPNVRTLHGHFDSVYCIQFDRKRLVSGSRDQTIKIWDMEGFSTARSLVGHTGSVLCLQFEQNLLVTGSSDSTVMVWDMELYQRKQVLLGHSSGVLDVALQRLKDSFVLVSCSKDATIKVWDYINGFFVLRCTLAGHRAAVNAIQLKGKTLVSASGDYLLKVWEIDNQPRHLMDLRGHQRGIACVAFDGRFIVSGSNDRTIKVWDIIHGACIRTLQGHTDLVRTLSLDPLGLPGILVSGSYDQTVRIWDWKSGKELHVFHKVHSSWVFNVACSPTHIVSASQDQSIVVYDYTSNVDISWII